MSATSPATVARELLQAPLMGSFVALVLYGITTIQTFFYFQTYPNDHIFLKLMVLSLWTLETIHSGLGMGFINHYLIDNFGDVDALIKIPWDVIACFQVGAMLTTARLALATTSDILAGIYLDWEDFRDHAYVLLLTGMVIGIINDTLAAAILALHLEEGRSGLSRTDQLINRLLAYTVATGAFTVSVILEIEVDTLLTGKLSLFNCLALITFLASKTTLIFLAFVQILMKVYANSALMSLNLRRYQGRSLGGPVDMGLSDFRAASFNTDQAGRDTSASSVPHVGKSSVYKTGKLEGQLDSKHPDHRHNDTYGEDDGRIRSGGVDDAADGSDNDSDGNSNGDDDGAGRNDDEYEDNT
ncbi:hypothetical protein BU15DRAFT_81146 [Melanogaster broomeanus]|nr:hypothetical protein BU15DRAFT_81146 [Melanogaster broomeanus]